MVQPCIWCKEEPSQVSMGQTAQSLTCSIMEKPHTGLDDCLNMLLSCFRKMMLALAAGGASPPFKICAGCGSCSQHARCRPYGDELCQTVDLALASMRFSVLFCLI